MKVRASGRAKQEIVRGARWWRLNRPLAPWLFIDELAAAERHLASMPEAGQRYGERRGRLIYRWLLPRSEFHVYYAIDGDAQIVTIHSVWGARRGRGPRL